MFTRQFGARALFREAGAAARFAAPIVGTRVFTFGQAMLVMVLLARESPVDMASLSLAAAIGQVLVMLGFGALIGTQTEIARLHGARDDVQVMSVLASSYLFAIACGVAFAFAGIAAVHIIGALGGPATGDYGEAFAVTVPAVQILALGMPAYCVYLASAYYLEATCQPKFDTALSIGGFVVVGIAAWLLIPDRLGLGLRPGHGAAWALTSMRMAQAIAAVCIVFAKTRGRMLGAFRGLAPVLGARVRTLLAIGVPFALADCITTVVVSSLTFLVGGLGVAALNVYQMSTHFLAVLMLAGAGVTTAITVRVTNAVGARDASAEKLAASGGLLLLALLDAGVVALFLLFPHAWASLYAADASVAGFVTSNQGWALLVFLAECPLILLIGIGRAKGLTVRLPIIKAACFAAIALPVTYAVVTYVKEPRPFMLLGLVPTVLVALAVGASQFATSIPRDASAARA